MNYNHLYNLISLVLFHLLLVAVGKLLFFEYVIKPSIQSHIKKLKHKLPVLDENTLKEYGIDHHPQLVALIYQVAKTLANSNDDVSQFLNQISELYDGKMSATLQKFLKNKVATEELDIKKKQYQSHLKMMMLVSAIIATIFVWFIIHFNISHIKTDWAEMILGNIIPITIIFSFEIFFFKQVAIKYQIMGETELLYRSLKKIYPIQ